VLVTALYRAPTPNGARHGGRPIEEQVSGVEGMVYMSSTSANDGSYTLTVTFKLGMATRTWRRCWCRTASRWRCGIPPLVQTEGINVQRCPPSTLMIVN